LLSVLRQIDKAVLPEWISLIVDIAMIRCSAGAKTGIHGDVDG
jgi:hypothetical protein